MSANDPSEVSPARGARRPPLRVTVSVTAGGEDWPVRLEEVRRALPGAEILLVDSDGRDVRAPVLSKSESLSFSRALRRAGGDVIVTLDGAAGRCQLEIMPELVELIRRGNDLVNTSRLRKRPARMPLTSFLAGRAFAAAARLLLRIEATDLHSSVRAYRKSMIDALHFDDRGPAVEVDMLLIPHRLGYRIAELPIDCDAAPVPLMRRLSTGWWTIKRIWKARRTPI